MKSPAVEKSLSMDIAGRQGALQYKKRDFDNSWLHYISEFLDHRSIDFTRKQYAKFSPQSAARAVLKALESGKISTNLPLSAA